MSGRIPTRKATHPGFFHLARIKWDPQPRVLPERDEDPPGDNVKEWHGQPAEDPDAGK